MTVFLHYAMHFGALQYFNSFELKYQLFYFFAENVYSGLNVKSKNNFCSAHFHAFLRMSILR